MGTCETCGARPDAGTPLTDLTELSTNVDATGSAIRLCPTCLERREARRWSLASREGQRLAEALEQRAAPPVGRYSYLFEGDARLHLVRLRPAWVHRHAEA